MSKTTRIAVACGQVVLALGLAVATTSLGVTRGLADPICDRHLSDTKPSTHDPEIEKRVTLFALQLFAGDPRFAEQWNKYLIALKKGDPNAAPNAPDLPNGDIRQLDASLDLHCLAQIEARVRPTGDGGLSLDIDDWRSYVNATMSNLVDKHLMNVQQAQELLNKVRPEDRAIAAADFTRDCFLSQAPYAARTNASGMIEIVEKK
jgi:hypothetical protein